MTALLGPDGGTLPPTNAQERLAALPSFTLGECMVIHTALLAARQKIQDDRERIIADHDKSTFIIIANNCHSAIVKLSVMVADAMDEGQVAPANVTATLTEAQRLIDQAQGETDD